MNVKVVKVVDTEKKYLDKKGNEHISVNYYLVLENGEWVAIRPAFGKGYSMLNAICDCVKNG